MGDVGTRHAAPTERACDKPQRAGKGDKASRPSKAALRMGGGAPLVHTPIAARAAAATPAAAAKARHEWNAATRGAAKAQRRLRREAAGAQENSAAGGGQPSHPAAEAAAT